jgi:phosphoribosylamine--glycine ligase
LFVIGSGGREHALVWHLRQHRPHTRVICAPGNPGIARLAACLPVQMTDGAGLAAAAVAHDVAMTIVGPEAPLVAGIADLFAARGLRLLGPPAAAAALEGSKVFAKEFMRRHGIPTAGYEAFDDPVRADAYLDRVQGPVVVKADGLAGGKGVVVCDDAAEARAAVRAMLVDRAFGEAGSRVVIEERLDGDEVSVFALVCGEAVALLPAAQDHKRIGDGDQGPNTGGMGAAAPFPLSVELRQRILRQIIQPVAAAMCAEGRPYHGVLFVGLMLTQAGPRVLEFNCRLGDPEAQAILPLLAVCLPDAFEALRSGGLREEDLAPAGAAVGVVVASPGYPGIPQLGLEIEGLERAERQALVFHSGTAMRDGRVVTAGGRVLTVVGRGADVAEARTRAYRAVAHLGFEGMQFRRDIGARLLRPSVPVTGRV